MNLVQLKYFQAVCTYHTVSDAAEYLHISQPSLSSAIKELEKEFGVNLFKRHHRGMTLTPEGEMLYNMSKELLSRAEQMETVMKDLGSCRQKLRLGVPPMIGSFILPDIYSRFLPDYPDVILDITEGGRSELLKKLSEDQLDLVFLPHDRLPEKNLAFRQVARFEIAYCTSQEHQLAGQNVVTPEKLKEEPLVLFESSFFQTEKIMQWFAERHVRPRILLQTAQLSTMVNLIRRNIGTGFMFKELAMAEEGLVAIPTEKPMYVDVSLFWKKDAYIFESMRRFQEYIKDYVMSE